LVSSRAQCPVARLSVSEPHARWSAKDTLANGIPSGFGRMLSHTRLILREKAAHGFGRVRGSS
jgi:hypothetical protein